jgi:hypothetical protein
VTAPSRRRNIAIGAISLLVLACLFGLGAWLQKLRATAEALVLAEANREMAAGLRGECAAFQRARALYYRAMRHHLQSRDLLGKTSLAADLARECENTAAGEALQTREHLLASGHFTFDDVKQAAIGRLARGDRALALADLAKLPDNEFCRWFGAWIRSLP